MGKIVKSAHIVDERYVVDVPVAELEAESPRRTDADDRFASHFAAPAKYESYDSYETYPGAGAPAIEEQLPEPPAPAVDWESLRSEAEAIVDRAAADAESLLKQAESAALELLAKARAEVSRIEAEAREDGRTAGLEDGRAAGQAELGPVISTFREVIEGVRAQRRAIWETAEPEIVRLAMAIAERIVHTEVANNLANVVVENVRSALTRIVSREVVTLRLNPADHDIIRQQRDAIHAASDVEHLRIVEDQRVDRGGVVVETEAGTIDAKIATQLMEARRAILTEEAIALGPSLDDEEMLQPSPAAS